jgi:flagellar motor switch protein FliN/FliY
LGSPNSQEPAFGAQFPSDASADRIAEAGGRDTCPVEFALQAGCHADTLGDGAGYRSTNGIPDELATAHCPRAEDLTYAGADAGTEGGKRHTLEAKLILNAGGDANCLADHGTQRRVPHKCGYAGRAEWCDGRHRNRHHRQQDLPENPTFVPLAKRTEHTADVRRTVIDSLPVTVEAVLGVAKVTVGELSAMKAGDAFALDSLLGDAVELRLNGQAIAYGELVSLGENFAVRIQAVAQS